MTLTDAAAWLGAATGTLALVWDVIKWLRSGARLHVVVLTGMHQLVGTKIGAVQVPGVFVTVRVANVGDQAATISGIVLDCYSSWFARLRREPSVKFMPSLCGGLAQLPYMISPGAQWDGEIKQEQFDKYRQHPILVLRLKYNGDSKPRGRQATFLTVSAIL
jgi:hypothetical protein